MITLVKLSSPGWKKKFSTVEEFKKELWSHICGMCRNGTEWGDHPINENSLIIDMHATPCGCEYDYDDPKGLLTPLS